MAYANVSSPDGFHPTNLDNIKSPVKQIRPVAANRAKTASATETVLCVGDPYTLDNDGFVRHAGPNDRVYGIVQLIKLEPVTAIMNAQGPVSKEVLLATDSGTIVGIEDNKVEFEVQADTFATTDRGGLFNLTDALYNSILRRSSVSLNVGGGVGLQFIAIDIVNRPTDNALGANARVKVKLAQTL